MLTLRSFINLFLVPVVALYFFLKKDIRIKKGFENYPEWFKVLIQYCIIVACNIPLTRVLTFAIKFATGTNMEADSSYYTIAALISALLLPVIYTSVPGIRKSLNRADKEVAEDNAASKEEKI